LDRCRSESAVELFTIQCTTCRARLVVHDEAVIGDILACPKCSSMVHVVPPVGWNSTMVEVAPQNPAVWPPTREATAPKSAPARQQSKSPQPAKAKAAAVIPPALPPRPAPPPAVAASPAPVLVPPPVLAAAKVAGQPPLPTVAAASAAVPPPVPNAVAIAGSVADSITSKNLTGTGLTATRWTKLATWAREEWKFLAGGVGAGIALGGIVWLVLALEAPSAPLVADLTNDARPPVATAVDPAHLPTPASPAGEIPTASAAAVEKTTASRDLTTDSADKLAGEPHDPIATTAPAAVEPIDKSTTTGPAQAAVRPAATDDKAPPVASAPRPTIKLEPAPAAPATVNQPPEAESIIDTGAADESADTPAVVRTPAAESLGAERPALSAAEVDERLSRALPTAQFTKVPLFHFIEFVAEFTTLPIQLDEPALKRAGKSRQSAVTIKLNETTAGDALRTALSDLGLVTTLRSGTLVVTVAPDAKGVE
jgi:hypothetical protein